MVEKISAENAYVRFMMDKLPDNTKGQEYTVKRGDSLWNLAKKELNKTKPATNAEISKYMLLIAKLNGLDTVEKMNGIKAEEVIYMPDTEFVSARELINSDYIDKEAPLTSAEESFQDVLNTVLTDKTISIKQAYPYVGATQSLYHVYKAREGRPTSFSSQSPVLSFNIKQDGKIDKISFEDVNGDKNSYGYDYDLTANGHITMHGRMSAPKGKISGEDFQKLETKLKDLAANCDTYSF